MKAYRRQLLRQIHKKPTTETMLKQALAVYDIENGYDALSDDVLSGLERVFGLEGVQWPSVRERMYMLLSKVSNSLKRLLRTYGYVFFSKTLNNSMAVLITNFMKVWTLCNLRRKP